jgi:hypothetical protein
MYGALTRPQAQALPPRVPPLPPTGKIAAGAADPDDAAWDAYYEAHMAMLDDGETATGCDWPDGPLSPTGCVW